jgi:hypothetical protein
MIARRLDDAAAIDLVRRIDELGAGRAKATYRPFLARAGQPRITRDIPRENRRQLAIDVLRSRAGSPGVEWRSYHRPIIVEFCPNRCDQPSTQGLIPARL